MWKVKQKCVLYPTRRENDKNVKFQPRKKDGEISFVIKTNMTFSQIIGRLIAMSFIMGVNFYLLLLNIGALFAIAEKLVMRFRGLE